MVDFKNEIAKLIAEQVSDLAEKKKPFALHVFPYGRHGLGLAKDTPLADKWFPLYIEWLNSLK